jgi:peptide/nickel transport system substrate-binding protein
VKKRELAMAIFCLLIIISMLAVISCQKQSETSKQPSGISASKESLEPAYGDLLVTASIADAKNLIGLLTTDSASHEIVSLVNDGLLDYDENLNIKAKLAESWEISEDNLTITFHLRRGVKWHDGVEFTSADVLFGYQTMVNPDIPTAYSGDFEMIEEATAPDPYTFIVKYKEPFSPGLYSWVGSLPILPRHLLEGKDIMTSEMGHRPVGVGPFKFKEWKPQHQITLVANENYWDGRPYLNGYIIRIIPDMSTIFLEVVPAAGSIFTVSAKPQAQKEFQHL